LMNIKLKMIEHFIFMADFLNGDIDKYRLIYFKDIIPPVLKLL